MSHNNILQALHQIKMENNISFMQEDVYEALKRSSLKVVLGVTNRKLHKRLENVQYNQPDEFDVRFADPDIPILHRKNAKLVSAINMIKRGGDPDLESLIAEQNYSEQNTEQTWRKSCYKLALQLMRLHLFENLQMLRSKHDVEDVFDDEEINFLQTETTQLQQQIERIKGTSLSTVSSTTSCFAPYKTSQDVEDTADTPENIRMMFSADEVDKMRCMEERDSHESARIIHDCKHIASSSGMGAIGITRNDTEFCRTDPVGMQPIEDTSMTIHNKRHFPKKLPGRAINQLDNNIDSTNREDTVDITMDIRDGTSMAGSMEEPFDYPLHDKELSFKSIRSKTYVPRPKIVPVILRCTFGMTAGFVVGLISKYRD